MDGYVEPLRFDGVADYIDSRHLKRTLVWFALRHPRSVPVLWRYWRQMASP